jgi:DNA-binding transcriptional ArsR family regulator
MFGTTATVTQRNPIHEGHGTGAFTTVPRMPPTRRIPVTMASNPLSDAVSPDVETVFDLLKSESTRRIVRALEGPMTAAEVAEACEVPRSTAYRKLRAMTEAGLLRKKAGDDAARYAVDFEAVVVRNPDGELDLELEVPTRSASEQLSALWGEVRAEASGN